MSEQPEVEVEGGEVEEGSEPEAAEVEEGGEE